MQLNAYRQVAMTYITRPMNWWIGTFVLALYGVIAWNLAYFRVWHESALNAPSLSLLHRLLMVVRFWSGSPSAACCGTNSQTRGFTWLGATPRPI